jgi:hypothetical protein
MLPDHLFFRLTRVAQGTRHGVTLLLLALTLACATQPATAQATASARDGAHDFDFEIGSWKTQLKRLLKPLSGSHEWASYAGTTVVRKVWNGRANLVELEADGPSGHFSGLSLRLYSPTARQWSLNFANRRGGELSLPPASGGFNAQNGRGEFYDQEEYNGRKVLVRFVITNITADSVHFEQSFSDDGGKTWELNWVADDTRMADRAVTAPPSPAPALATATADTTRDDAHAFDFDHGNWRTRSSRLLKPLTGSTTWTEMEGVTAVKKIWGGAANLAEFKADGAAGPMELLSLRLFNPGSGQWNLNFATPGVGTLGVPGVGSFDKSGRGVFYDQESINGKTVLVRFSIWPITADTAQSEQAFSQDGGKTWEVNWINRYTRMAD